MRSWSKRDLGERSRRDALRRNFRLSPGDYDEMFARQGGVCAICGGPEDAGRHLAVDHDHDHCDVCNEDGRSCGQSVRMLLCMRCNTNLGLYERFRLEAERYLDHVAQLGPFWWKETGR